MGDIAVPSVRLTLTGLYESATGGSGINDHVALEKLNIAAWVAELYDGGATSVAPPGVRNVPG
jgi:hypothetical protein